MRISLPRVRGCSVSSAPHSGSAIYRLSLAGGLLQGKGCRRCSQTSSFDDTVPFRLSRNHFMIEKRDGNYYVRDLCSTHTFGTHRSKKCRKRLLFGVIYFYQTFKTASLENIPYRPFGVANLELATFSL